MHRARKETCDDGASSQATLIMLAANVSALRDRMDRVPNPFTPLYHASSGGYVYKGPDVIGAFYKLNAAREDYYGEGTSPSDQRRMEAARDIRARLNRPLPPAA